MTVSCEKVMKVTLVFLVCLESLSLVAGQIYFSTDWRAGKKRSSSDVETGEGLIDVQNVGRKWMEDGDGAIYPFKLIQDHDIGEDWQGGQTMDYSSGDGYAKNKVGNYAKNKVGNYAKNKAGNYAKLAADSDWSSQSASLSGGHHASAGQPSSTQDRQEQTTAEGAADISRHERQTSADIASLARILRATRRLQGIQRA